MSINDLIYRGLEGVEKLTPNSSCLHKRAQQLRIMPRQIARQVFIKETSELGTKLKEFIAEKPKPSSDDLDNFLFENNLWVLKPNLNKISPKARRKNLQDQIRRLNCFYAEVLQLNDDALKSQIAKFLRFDCYSSIIESIVDEKDLDELRHGQALVKFAKDSGFTLNMHFELSLHDDTTQNTSGPKSIFIPVNLREVDFSKGTEDRRILERVFFPYIKLPEKLTSPVLGSYLSTKDGISKAGSAGAEVIYMNDGVLSRNHLNEMNESFRARFNAKLAPKFFEEQSNIERTILVHEMTHQITKNRIPNIGSKNENHFRDMTLSANKREYSIESNSQASEILSHTAEMLVSPNITLMQILQLPNSESYIGPARQIIIDHLAQLFRSEGVALNRIPINPNNIYKIIGEDLYELFLSQVQDDFVGISNQILAHLKNKDLILEEPNPELSYFLMP